MIVDPDETSVLLLKEVLLMVLTNSDDYQIVSVESGKEALDLCRRKNPCIVFTEIRLKDIDGFQFTKSLKEHNPKIPVIIETAVVEDHFEKKACECGCDGYLTKPLDFSELEILVKQLIRFSLNGTSPDHDLT
jgi:CheY-like chemotaxis protein